MGEHLGPDQAPLLWKESCPSPDHIAPNKGCSLLHHRSLTFTGHGWMGVPSRPMQHRADIQATASLASRSQRALWPRLPVGSAGSRMMGLQFPSRVSLIPGNIWVSPCGTGWILLSHPTLCRGQGQGPETLLGSWHTLKGRVENKLHVGPSPFLHPGRHY